MYTDSITPDFVIIFIAVLLAVLSIFPIIDYVSYWRAKRELPGERAKGDDDVKK